MRHSIAGDAETERVRYPMSVLVNSVQFAKIAEQLQHHVADDTLRIVQPRRDHRL